MLLDPHGRKLGDKHLSKEEALKRTYEQTDRDLQQYRIEDQEDFKNVERRMGRSVHHKRFVTLVTRVNPRLWAEDSLRDDTVVGFYFAGQDGNKKFAGAFDKGVMPEWSIVFTDRADLPCKHKKGWRTVLVNLLHQRLLSMSQVREIVKELNGSANVSKHWHLNIRGF